MKSIPYYFVGASYLLLSLFIGAMIVAGSNYLKNMARMEGAASVLIQMELEQLSRLDIYDL